MEITIAFVFGLVLGAFLAYSWLKRDLDFMDEAVTAAIADREYFEQRAEHFEQALVRRNVAAQALHDAQKAKR